MIGFAEKLRPLGPPGMGHWTVDAAQHDQGRLLRLGSESVAELLFSGGVKFQIDHDDIGLVLPNQGECLLTVARLQGRHPATRKRRAEHFS